MSDFWSGMDGMTALGTDLVSRPTYTRATPKPKSLAREVWRCRCGQPQRGRTWIRKLVDRLKGK